MKREELEHVLRAASYIVNQRDFLVIGSAKLAAGRVKDFEFVDALLRAGLLDLAILADRVETLPKSRVPAAFHARAKAWVQNWQ